MPLFARIFAACVVAYAFSPIDLIPDFIPIVGHLDDLVLIPIGVWLSIKMIPHEVMIEYRAKAQAIIQQGKPINRVAAIVIIGIWLLVAALAIALIASRAR